MAVLNKTGLERLWLHIVSNLNKKVDKVEGKGLSTNDYTTEEKAKLATLDTLVGETSVADQISTAISTIDYPVDSVNEKTGAVVLTADDVHALDVNDYYGPIKKIDSIVSVDTIEGLAIHPTSYIEPVQEGEGDPSPDNVRAISGWSKVTARRTGKNLFNPLNVKERTIYDVTASRNEDGSIHLSGSPARGIHYIKPDDNVFLCLPAGTYYLTPDNFELHSLDKKYNGVFTLTKETEFTNGAIRFSNTADTLDINVYIQLECGSTATDYEPYTAQTLTADLPETIYGGTVDWTTGVLTVDRKQRQINQAYTLYDFPGDGHIGGQVTASDMRANSRANGMCDKLTPAMSPKNQAKPCITFGADNKTIYFILPSTIVGTTLETLNAYLAENPLTVVYPLDTPYTIHLTPQQLSTIDGTNNVWSNCGDTEALINLTPINIEPITENYTKLAEEVSQLSEEIGALDALINGVESSGGDEPSGGEAQRIAFEFGGMDTSGNLVTNQVRIRSELFSVSTGVNNYQLFIGGENYYFYGCTGFLNGAYARKVNYNEYVTDITNGTFSVTSDGTFDAVRIVFKKTDDSTFSQMEVDGTYLLGENGSTPGDTSPTVVGGLKADVYRWQGKKLAAIGDSITYGYIPRNAPGYPGKLNSYAVLAAERLKMGVVNEGVIGSTVSNQEDKSPMCNRYDELPDDADIVTVMGGTNDVRIGVSLGTMDDRTTDTYYGALHTLLGGLYKKYYIDQQRNTKIIVMTPIKLLQSSASEIGGTGTLRSWDDWIEAVKKVAAYYSMPVLDMYNLSRINPHLNQTVQGTTEGYTGVYNPYITDGTHPTQEGHELMADALVGFIRNLD